MSGKVLVTFLIAIVLADVVKVFTTDDDGVLHLCAFYDSCKDASANRNVPGEWALFINVGAVDGFGGRGKAKSNVLVPAATLVLWNNTLIVQKDSVLFGKSFQILKV